MRRDPYSGDVVESAVVEHLLRFVVLGGINAPWIIDRFTYGKQSARINYVQFQYNQRLVDTLWPKPDNVKSIK
jgi:hypothetical protein